MWRWTREWLRIRRVVKSARARKLGANVEANIAMPVRVTDALIEPGVFGIWRPVLLIPARMLERLSPSEFASVLAHEMSHVRRRDNLTAFLHMLVEATFWFHPLVWWIGIKLVEERERACDEAVLRLGNAPEAYAEGILKVCEFCIEPGAACAAGVTGADLKQRIGGIMANRIAEKLGVGKKAMLAACAIVAIATPMLVGVLHAQSASKVAFEVASVKPNTLEDRRGIHFETLPGGRLSIRGAPLFFIIAWAYDVPFQGAGSRLSGHEKDPIFRETYDIEATADKSAIANDKTTKERDDKIRAMLRNLLAERFHLVVRNETKDVPVYAAVVGKNGTKLEKSKLEEKDCEEGADQQHACHEFNGGMGRGLHAQAADMADLVKHVANWSDRPIIDRTGLKGLFKIETPGWAPVDAPRGDGSKAGEDGVPWSERPTLFTIFEGMGLKLEATHAPIEKVVIVSVERPVAN